MSSKLHSLVEGMNDPRDLVYLLTRVKEKLPQRLREKILKNAPAVIPHLIELMSTEELAWVDSPGEGSAPIHAVELLQELRVLKAIEPMLSLLEGLSLDDILFTAVMQALMVLGPTILEPALRALSRSENEDVHLGLCEVLANLGVKDPRILERQREEVQEVPPRARHNSPLRSPTDGSSCFSTGQQGERIQGGSKPRYRPINSLSQRDKVTTWGMESQLLSVSQRDKRTDVS
jgi:hypothetical protein